MSKYDIVGEIQSYLVEGMSIPADKIREYILLTDIDWIIHNAKFDFNNYHVKYLPSETKD